MHFNKYLGILGPIYLFSLKHPMKTGCEQPVVIPIVCLPEISINIIYLFIYFYFILFYFFFFFFFFCLLSHVINCLLIQIIVSDD